MHNTTTIFLFCLLFISCSSSVPSISCSLSKTWQMFSASLFVPGPRAQCWSWITLVEHEFWDLRAKQLWTSYLTNLCVLVSYLQNVVYQTWASCLIRGHIKSSFWFFLYYKLLLCHPIQAIVLERDRNLFVLFYFLACDSAYLSSSWNLLWVTTMCLILKPKDPFLFGFPSLWLFEKFWICLANHPHLRMWFFLG